MPRASTLKDIAARSGVSTATVRRVLYRNGYVAEGTRRAVEAAIAETGYRVNVVARGLRQKRTLTIGHVVHSIVPNPFFAGVALGAEEEALAHGCTTLLFNVHGDPAQERAGIEALIERRVDAIIFTGALDAANVRLAQEAQVPVVQVERLTATPTHQVVVDNWVGVVAAIEHLIALGHRRIAFIGVDPDTRALSSTVRRHPTIERERLAGYRDAVLGNGLSADDALIILGTYAIADGLTASHRLLALPQPPSAIFAAADIIAAGVLQGLYAAGRRVPADVSIIGFDDTYAPYFAPPLTTVAQPMIEMGRMATRIAIEQLQANDANPTPRVERLATHLVVRASTGPAPNSA